MISSIQLYGAIACILCLLSSQLTSCSQRPHPMFDNTRDSYTPPVPNGPVKVIDVTMYNGEPIALLRYYYLKDFVDYFFIVESLESFSGKKKTVFAIEENARYFAPIRSKVIVLKLDNLTVESKYLPGNATNHLKSKQRLAGYCFDCWAREEYQRNILREKISSVMGQQPFVALMCDIDEIPSIDLVKQLPRMYHGLHDGAFLEMTHLLYNFRWMYQRQVKWRKAFVLTDR